MHTPPGVYLHHAWLELSSVMSSWVCNSSMATIVFAIIKQLLHKFCPTVEAHQVGSEVETRKEELIKMKRIRNTPRCIRLGVQQFAQHTCYV